MAAQTTAAPETTEVSPAPTQNAEASIAKDSTVEITPVKARKSTPTLPKAAKFIKIHSSEYFRDVHD